MHSVEASNRIEGIHTSNKRLAELISEKTTPKKRDEEEAAGYRDVLATIHKSFDSINPTPSIILKLHRDLHRYTESAFGGSWKSTDRVVTEVGEDGEQIVRFNPIPAVATSLAMDNLYEAYQGALHKDIHDPLILTCMFIFDFVCIHPFNDGNGRMSRLLTLLLLYRSGYLIGKYISVEKMIEHSKDAYDDVLRVSSIGWNEGANDYGPFIRYQLGVMVAAYREFSGRIEGLVIGKKSKAERVEGVFDRKLGKITKKDILEQLPDISAVTVARTLSALLEQGKIKKLSLYVQRGM